MGAYHELHNGATCRTWDDRLEKRKRDKGASWQAGWGIPGQRGCKAHPDALRKHGFDVYDERGNLMPPRPVNGAGSAHNARLPAPMYGVDYIDDTAWMQGPPAWLNEAPPSVSPYEETPPDSQRAPPQAQADQGFNAARRQDEPPPRVETKQGGPSQSRRSDKEHARTGSVLEDRIKELAGTLAWTGADMPEPHPLPSSLLPVASFEMSLMPEKLRPWADDVSTRMQCPPDFIGVAAMVEAGSLIGRKVAIRPQMKNDWTELANQWGMPIGRPGLLKTPAMEEALWPMKKLAASAKRGYEMEMGAFKTKAKIAEITQESNRAKAKNALKAGASADEVAFLLNTDEVQEPALRRFIANDTNVASLHTLLRQNPNGLLIHKDEIMPLLAKLSREENADDLGFYLTGWSGKSDYTQDRIGRGLHLGVEGICLSVLGSTQPSRITPYLINALRDGQGGDGLIQRFGLLVWPDVSPEWTHIDRRPNGEAKKAAMEVFERLEMLRPEDVQAHRDQNPYTGEPDGLPYLRFSRDAYDLFVEWRTALEKQVRSDDLHPVLEGHFTKYRKLVPGLALIHHLAGDPGPDGKIGGQIDVDAVRTALAWAKYLETHARRAYGSATAAAGGTARVILAKIKSGDLKTKFTARDVLRPQWSRLTDLQTINDGLQMLVDHFWLEAEKVDTGGRPALLYHVNPKATL